MSDRLLRLLAYPYRNSGSSELKSNFTAFGFYMALLVGSYGILAIFGHSSVDGPIGWVLGVIVTTAVISMFISVFLTAAVGFEIINRLFFSEVDYT